MLQFHFRGELVSISGTFQSGLNTGVAAFQGSRLEGVHCTALSRFDPFQTLRPQLKCPWPDYVGVTDSRTSGTISVLLGKEPCKSNWRRGCISDIILEFG